MSKKKHRMYCAKSGIRCLVLHPDGMCPDIRDCEACKAEKPAPTPPTKPVEKGTL